MSTLTVGIGMQYATIAEAVAASENGDVVAVQAGTYTNDFVEIDDSITLESIGGMSTINATVAPPNEKGIILVGQTGLDPDVTIDGFVLTGAAISSAEGNNGAGIRYESGNLTLNNDVISDNQDGLLATPYVANTGTIIVNTSTFSANGAGDGQSHNIYVNHVAQFTFEDSISINAVVGHDIKSRAENTTIINSTIGETTGTASYEIDLPNGGNVVIQGNTIEKGPNSENPAIISYGEEGTLIAGSALTVSGNTILDNLSSPSSVGIRNTTTVIASITNNQYYGLTAAQLETGPATLSGNTALTTEPPFPGTGGTPPPPPPVLTVSESNAYVHVGNAPITVTLTGADDYVYGGTGGMTLTDTGAQDDIITEAGSSNVLDFVTAAKVTTAGANAITTGAGTVALTNSGSDTISAGAGALSLEGLAGGSTTVSGGASAFTYDGQGGTLDFVGGSGTEYFTPRTGLTTIAFGSGSNQLNVGTGDENLVFRAGEDSTRDLISGYNASLDTLTFQGFTGDPVASQSSTGGSSYATLTDGTHITFYGTPSVSIT